ncbi:MAG: polysaccharide deacetylase family protein [Actinobacteria bacterium]|nr:polysaccharide deacetylase family protein [Actinomycetota bacterium]
MVCGIGFGIFWYFHTLPILVSVNDTEYELDYKTTYQDLHDQGMLVATYGDFLAVDGSIIEQGGGAIYKILDDGELVTDYSARLHKNDVITEARGDDVTEESSIVETVIPWTWDVEDSYNFYNGSLSLVVNEGTDGVDRMETGKVSGITILSPTSVAMVPRLIRTYTLTPADGQKVIALTFDDGPNPDATPQMLDLLNEFNAKATFFVLGENVEAFPELAKKVAEQGSQVASHSYSHASSDYLDRISSEAIANQLSLAQTAIVNATGVTTTVVRPPGGNFDYDSWSGTGSYLTAAVGWDIDTEDWKKPGADVIASRAISSAKPGCIILMHDGGGDRSQSIEAARIILETLTAQGYTFVTVDELIQIQRDQLKAEGVIPS